jgi:chromate reductase, NAD(P)H dehydrogenase (quinone)
MTTPIHVLGISGSLRQRSLNSALLRAAKELLPDDMTLELFDLAPLPLYDADVEAQGLPASVQHFRADIATADALLIACPEYNYAVTGVLKNAIDWASRPDFSTQPPGRTPLWDKPLAMMGAGGQSGTMRAQFQLRHILVHSNVHVLNTPQVYLVRAGDKFDAQGQLSDAATRTQIHALLVALAAWTRRLRG